MGAGFWCPPAGGPVLDRLVGPVLELHPACRCPVKPPPVCFFMKCFALSLPRSFLRSVFPLLAEYVVAKRVCVFNLHQ